MWNREQFQQLCSPPVIGMIHLQPLPGSPRWAGDLAAVVDHALADADGLVAGGVGGLMVENFHDVPFFPRRVPPVTIAAMTAVAARIRARHRSVPLGINVLRNDAQAALAVAAVVGADFIRVNVHVGTAATDQGLIAGRAAQTLRLRRELGAKVGVLADLRVKHARPLAERPLVEEAADLRLRGLADAVIITGKATGSGADPSEVRAVRAALPDCPLLVGSGITAETVGSFAPFADGYIVGTSLQQGGAEAWPAVDSAKARQLLAALAAATAPKERS